MKVFINFAEWRGIQGVFHQEGEMHDQSPVNEYFDALTPTGEGVRQTNCFHPSRSARLMLSTQLNSASQEMEDLKTVLAMLPSEMTQAQNDALCRLLQRGDAR